MDFANDLSALKAITEELEAYLLSDVEFWQLGGSSQFPKLSLGTYLLTRQRLLAAPDHRAEITALCQRGDAILAQWQTAAERKAAKELHMRLTLWQNYLDDWQGDYATEVAQRMMAALLLRRFPRLSTTPDAAHFNALDARLQGRTQKAAFVWAPELRPAFPEDDFWFLYRQPLPPHSP
ncbi:MAG: hypothetical protein NZM11_06690 [Anaerolineales bacterium]|nr:hypothetical protein [Anaerolineales bacterium]